MSDFPILRPTKIYRPVWAGRRVSGHNQYATSVHYHGGTAFDGCALSTWKTFLNIPTDLTTFNPPPILLVNPILSTIGTNNSTYGETNRNYATTTGQYGYPGKIIKPPKMIRVIHAGGYHSWEHYPGVPSRFASRKNNGDLVFEGTQSIYLGTVPDYTLEPTVDYLDDLHKALLGYCQSNDIMLSQMFYPYVYTTYDFMGGTKYRYGDLDQDAFGGFGSSVSDLAVASKNIWHQGRWLYNLAARYYVPAVNNIPVYPDSEFQDKFQGPLTEAGQRFIPVNEIVGGEVLNIVFVTDAYGAYHGLTYDPTSVRHINDTLFNVGSNAIMNQDLARIKQQFPRFKKWGLVIVNSPKNAEFFPAWFTNLFWAGGISTRPSPMCYCLKDAQDHFKSVAGKLENFNTKLLIRDVSVGSGSIHDPENLIEDTHLNFSGGQITINEIMSAVRDFWG